MAEKIKVIFLGTSDAVPTATRNHPAFLLNYKGESILVDCGEATQRQLRKAKLNPCKINRLLITHWHADHVLGIPGLIKTMNLSGYNKTLYVYGPKGTKKLMKKLLGLFAVKKNLIKVKEVSGKFLETSDFYLKAETMQHGTPCNAYCFVKKQQLRIDKAKLKKYKILSGPHLQKLKQGKNIRYKGKKYSSKNLTFTEDSKKISFVLDTILNKKINGFVKDSDVFICESAFSHALKDKAKEHKHLTAKQVGEIAKKAKVKNLYLVHVSQRYGKNPKEILNEAKKIFKKTHLPKDLDKVEI